MIRSVVCLSGMAVKLQCYCETLKGTAISSLWIAMAHTCRERQIESEAPSSRELAGRLMCSRA